jgi:hypothetical protein
MWNNNPGNNSGNSSNLPTLRLPELSPNTRQSLKKYGPFAICTFIVFFYLPSAWTFYNSDWRQSFSQSSWDLKSGPAAIVDRLLLSSFFYPSERADFRRHDAGLQSQIC